MIKLEASRYVKDKGHSKDKCHEQMLSNIN
jgi:hypothetical protein